MYNSNSNVIISVFYSTLILLVFLRYVNSFKIHTNSTEINDGEEIIKYYKSLIEENSKEIYNDLPKNAEEYRPTYKDHIGIDYGTFDFIIIGSGTTGSIVASRLSEIANWTVLVLEPGNFGNNYTDIPAMFSLNHTWAYESVPQSTACLGLLDNKCPYPRGKGVGGTSLNNGLVYSRGNKQDFDRWAKNGTDWSFEDVLPYFKKSEDFHQNDNTTVVDWDYHGKDGPLYVEYPLPEMYDNQIFLDANLELGVNITDLNGNRQLGAAIAQKTTKHGKRQDTGTAFLKPIMNERSNLRIFTGSYVTKILFDNSTGTDNKRAVTVQFTRNGRGCRAHANKEIILSAGVLVTPQILMLSGVGPEDHLKELGIDVVANLSVGKTLWDHSMYDGLVFSSNSSGPNGDLESLIKQYLNGIGPLTSMRVSCGFYLPPINKTQSDGLPEFELVMTPPNATSPGNGASYLTYKEDTWNATYRDVDVLTTFKIAVLLLYPKSTGSIKLKSKNPFDYPLIDSNLLSDERDEDIETLYRGIQVAFDLVETEAFKKINASLSARQLPACAQYAFRSKDYWYCALRQLTYAAFHPVGSCPMGMESSHGAVVDSNLKVFGFENLRIADASIFPSAGSGNPAAACFMIGEKASDIIKKAHNIM